MGRGARIPPAHRHRPRDPEEPGILTFDEAASALDADAEQAIVRELDRLARARTMLIITHRLSTIVKAHAIIVMERGRIAERGARA